MDDDEKFYKQDFRCAKTYKKDLVDLMDITSNTFGNEVLFWYMVSNSYRKQKYY